MMRCMDLDSRSPQNILGVNMFNCQCVLRGLTKRRSTWSTDSPGRPPFREHRSSWEGTLGHGLGNYISGRTQDRARRGHTAAALPALWIYKLFRFWNLFPPLKKKGNGENIKSFICWEKLSKSSGTGPDKYTTAPRLPSPKEVSLGRSVAHSC